jgi:hypothetical protein
MATQPGKTVSILTGGLLVTTTYPNPADVREGIVYGNNAELTGTMSSTQSGTQIVVIRVT